MMISRPPSSPARVVITGPTGWIGSALLARIAATRADIWPGSIRLFGSSARSITVAGQTLAVAPLSALQPADLDDAIVVHLAYLTKEKADLLGEGPFTATNIAIDDHVLSAVAHSTPRSLFVASSGAAGLAARGVDRHPYGLTKLRQEDRFLDLAARRSIPIIAGRIFNIAGPYMNKLDAYAMSAFLVEALSDGKITIKAGVPVFRSFLHVFDLCDLILKMGEQGISRPSAVDLCGPEVVEMEDIAAHVADAVGGNIPITRGEVDYQRPSAYLGAFADTKALAMEAAIPIRGLSCQVADTYEWVRAALADTRHMAGMTS